MKGGTVCEYGTCKVCGNVYALRGDGAVRRHRQDNDTRGRPFCAGSLWPPALPEAGQ